MEVKFQGITGLFEHKKSIMALAASVLALISFHNGLTEAQIGVVLAPVTAFIFGQAWVDGKEKENSNE